MRWCRGAWAVLSSGVLVALASCSESGSIAGDGASGGGGSRDAGLDPGTVRLPDGAVVPDPSLTDCTSEFASVQAEIFDKKCAMAGCHGASAPAGGLSLTASDSPGQLLGVDSALCTNAVRVVPGDAQASLLYTKLAGTQPTDCGDRMPLGGMLSDAELACVRGWIDSLADVDAGPPDPGCETCGGSACVDVQADALHCGACGDACAPGAACVAGRCECAVGTEACGGACVNTQTDLRHCGGCDQPCSGPAACVAGVCECAPGTEPCGGSCVDTQADGQHCGGCDAPCTGPNNCKAGSCQVGGCVPLTLCDKACVDVDTSFFHCGGCGQACATGEACSGGACGCADGTADCGSGCVDVSGDPSNCGGCGQACGAGESCQAGTCKCPGGGSSCGGSCIDTDADEANCGGCGVRCAPGQTCEAGTCTCGATGASFADVEAILNASCAAAGCHTGAKPRENLALASGASYAELVDVTATQCSDGRKLVAPGNPQNSYLIDKLLGVDLCSGSQMPKAGQSLPAADLATISNWICAGAKP